MYNFLLLCIMQLKEIKIERNKKNIKLTRKDEIKF